MDVCLHRVTVAELVPSEAEDGMDEVGHLERTCNQSDTNLQNELASRVRDVPALPGSQYRDCWSRRPGRRILWVIEW